MNNPVVIKGNKYGITLVLDDQISFLDLLEAVSVKFKDASGFFNTSQQTGIAFEGRKLSNSEQDRILTVINDNSNLNICYVIDKDDSVETRFEQAKSKSLEVKEEVVTKEKSKEHFQSIDENGGRFYKGTLRSGQILESDTSIVVVGDVNPGAKIVAKGNIVVIGALKGTAYAGVDGDSNAFIIALAMEPTQVRIGELYGRGPDKVSFLKDRKKEAKIAFVENDNIYIEPISKSVLNDII